VPRIDSWPFGAAALDFGAGPAGPRRLASLNGRPKRFGVLAASARCAAPQRGFALPVNVVARSGRRGGANIAARAGSRVETRGGRRGCCSAARLSA
jgi:hypothetical protein